MSDDFNTQCSGCGEYAGTHIHQKLAEQKDRIREQRELLDQCERALKEIRELTDSPNLIIGVVDRAIAKLRGQEKADG